MDKIIPVVNDLVYLDDDGETHPIPVSYREREAEGVPTAEILPSIAVQPQGTGYSVLGMGATMEDINQIAEQIIPKFRFKDRANEEGNLRLANVRNDQHGGTHVAEFQIDKVSKE